MRLQRRPLRAAVACLLGTVVVLGLTAVPASAEDPSGQPIVGATIGGAHAEVNPGTPVWMVEIVFTGIQGVDCTTLGALGAELHYALDTGGQGTDQDKLNLCPAGSQGPVTEARYLRPVVGAGIAPTEPGQEVQVWGQIRYKGDAVEDVAFVPSRLLAGPGKPAADPLKHVVMPLAPVWIGVGDGYTSAVEQVPAVCPVGDTSAACTSLDNPLSSWVKKAVDRLNGDKHVNGTSWALTYLNAAVRGARAADLVPGTGQLAALTTKLTALAPPVGGPRPSSWNWVGVTAGLEDSTILSNIASWYAGANAPTATSPNPWDVAGTNAALCPTLTGVPAVVSGQRTVIQDGILNTIAAALRADKNVRIVHPLYPYFAEQTAQADGYVSPCRTQVVDAVKAVDDAVAGAALATRIGGRADLADIVGMNGLGRTYDVDLRISFDPLPTGVRQVSGTTLTRVSSPIQLTKPFGFPYPSSLGSDRIADKVLVKLRSLQNPVPPTVTPHVRAADTPAGWYNSPVTVEWRVFDPAGDTIPSQFTPVLGEGIRTLTSPANICSSSGLCAPQVTTQNVPIDLTKPIAGFAARGDQNQVVRPNDAGWYNEPVTLSWDFGSNPPGRDVNGNILDESQIAQYDRSSVPAGDLARFTNAKDQTLTVPANSMCDLAHNCANVAVPINVDTVPPVVQTSTSPARVNGWFNRSSGGTAVLKWSATDDGALASGIKGADIVTRTVNISLSGTWTEAAPAPFSDVADNRTPGAPIVVQVDRIDPVATLTGTLGTTTSDVLAGQQFPAGTFPTSFGCNPTDDGGSGIDMCTVRIVDTNVITSVGTTYTYELKVRDKAGNETTSTVPVTALGQFRTNPPIVTGVVGPQPNALGWNNTAATVTWSYQEGSPSAGLTQAAITAFNAAHLVTLTADGKTTVSAPTICDRTFPAKPAVDSCSAPVQLPVWIDRTAPTIKVGHVTQGAVYVRGSAPTPDCTGTDVTSGYAEGSCQVKVTTTALGPYDPPGLLYSVTAFGFDNAGNRGDTVSAVTYKVFEITATTSGRMTGSGKVGSSSTQAEFTLRCNGSPNQLDVDWSGGSFDLVSIDKILCWDQGDREGSPDAPIDSLWASGRGILKNGHVATIEFTLTDRGEPGRDRDTLSFSIYDTFTKTTFTSAGLLSGGGNVQAHAATGNGTNDNGHVNGPNGHYDHDGYDSAGWDPDGFGRDGFDHGGRDRDGCDRRGYDRSGVRRKAAWTGYDRRGKDRDGFDEDGYDSRGLNRSGFDRDGYDDDGYTREGTDRDGCDRNGYDERGVKRKYGSRR